MLTVWSVPTKVRQPQHRRFSDALLVVCPRPTDRRVLIRRLDSCLVRTWCVVMAVRVATSALLSLILARYAQDDGSAKDSGPPEALGGLECRVVRTGVLQGKDSAPRVPSFPNCRAGSGNEAIRAVDLP
jgi:hypothetical protein